MNKKSLLSIILTLMLSFTTVIPASAPVFAADDSVPAAEAQEVEIVSAEQNDNADDVVPEESIPVQEADEELPVQEVTEELPATIEENNETPQPEAAVGDGIAAGAGSYIMDYVQTLNEDDSWTRELKTPRACTIEFFVAADYWMSSWFHIKITNNDTGEETFSQYDYIYDDEVFSDTISLDAGNYTITFINESSGSRDFNMYAYYTPLHTADDPYYHIEFHTGNIYDNYVLTGKTLQLKAAVLPAPATYSSVKWSSADPAIATVDQAGLVKGVSAGVTVITANIDGHICTTEMYVFAPEYSSLNYKELTLYPQQTETLKINVEPADYGLDGLKWSSSNTKVATVDSKGVVTAKAKGTATITASVNGVTRTCKVIVKATAISKTKATVYVKKTQQLKVNGGTGTTTWKSSNKKVATVSSKGVVKGIKPGTATITAKKNGKTYKCKVTVKWEPENGKVTTKKYTVDYYEDFDINMKGSGSFKVTMTNTDSGDYAEDMTLYIHNPKFDTIATKTVAPGKTLTFTLKTSIKGDYGFSCYGPGTITVVKTQKPALSKTSMTVGKGYTGATLKTYGIKNGGKWSSSNKKIATVNSKGVVKGKKKGSCYIKYTMKTGKVLKCKVTVVNPVTVKVTSVTDEYIYNDCWVKFNNYTNKKISYIEFNIKQYDGRGYRVSSPYDYYYMDYTIAAKSSRELEYWVNDSARKCTAYIKKVWFTDGSTWRP